MPFRLLILFFIQLFHISMYKVAAQTGPDINYDEAKVGTYTLPDPLTLPGGKRVTSTAEWIQKQRPHLLQLFAENVYGKMPGKPKDQSFKVRSVDSFALNGTAIRKQVRVYFSRQDTTTALDVLLYLPKNTSAKVPVFTGLNFAGNQTIHADPGIFLTKSWVANEEEYKSVNNQATDASRGIQAGRWPVEKLVAQGYGLATAYYGDLEP